MTKPPISFTDKASTSSKGAGGYPVQISAKDLDANFVYATIEISNKSPQGEAQPFLVDEITGSGGLTQRRLIFNPPVPKDGTHVFGAVNGVLQWIATEEC